MTSRTQLASNLLVKLGEVTGRTHALPMVLFAPTSRCNSRCVSCDWWRADGKSDLTLDEIDKLAAALPRFGTRVVVLTGGEPLVRSDVMEVADLFRARGLRLHLLTSGLALERFASAVAARFEEVTVSLDGHTPALYREIRGVDGLETVTAGVARLRALAPGVRIRARTTLHRLNFRYMPDLIARSKQMGVDQISFLAADVTSDAFNRKVGLPQADDGAAPRLLLDEAEADELETIVDGVIRAHEVDIDAGRIAPDGRRLRALAAYYRAHLGRGPFPPVDCNAPWMSVVIEASGAVRPCFFHPAVGNLRERPLDELLAVPMPVFRRQLTVAADPICQRCVCTLKVGLRTQI